MYYVQNIYYTFNSVDSIIVLYNFMYSYVRNLNLKHTFKLLRLGRKASNMLNIALHLQDFGLGNCHDHGISANS